MYLLLSSLEYVFSHSTREILSRTRFGPACRCFCATLRCRIREDRLPKPADNRRCDPPFAGGRTGGIHETYFVHAVLPMCGCCDGARRAGLRRGHDHRRLHGSRRLVRSMSIHWASSAATNTGATKSMPPAASRSAARATRSNSSPTTTNRSAAASSSSTLALIIQDKARFSVQPVFLRPDRAGRP